MRESEVQLRDFFDLFDEDSEEEQDERHSSLETLMDIPDPSNNNIIWSVYTTRVDAATQTEPEDFGGADADEEAGADREPQGSGEPVQALVGPIIYADDIDLGDWLASDGEDDIFYPGMETPPSPLSDSSDSGNDEPAISIQELEAEREDQLATELREWLNNYTA